MSNEPSENHIPPELLAKLEGDESLEPVIPDDVLPIAPGPTINDLPVDELERLARDTNNLQNPVPPTA